MQNHNDPFYPADQRHDYKFVSIANEIIKFIENKEFKVGQKLPSVNELRREFGVSKNTVIRSYRYLNDRKIVKGVPGKGSFLVANDPDNREKILCVFNNITDYKDFIFSSILKNLEPRYRVDLIVFDYDFEAFNKIIEENVDAYDYFVIMPFFRNEEKIKTSVLSTIANIAPEKLILIDKYPSFLPYNLPTVYQDFENDLFHALESAMNKVRKYSQLSLVVPDMEYTSPKEIVRGFIKFCKEKKLNFETVKLNNIDRSCLKDHLFIVLEEGDLVEMLKWLKESNLQPGSDVGVISYNDHPFKELLNISTFSTNFNSMGRCVSEMILRKERESIKNEFHFIDRGSA